MWLPPVASMSLVLLMSLNVITLRDKTSPDCHHPVRGHRRQYVLQERFNPNSTIKLSRITLLMQFANNAFRINGNNAIKKQRNQTEGVIK